MEYRKVTAIFNVDRLEQVEKRLQAIGVRGLSVSRVKGYGEYADFYSPDWLSDHARVEIFTRRDKAESIAEAIMEAAHTGTAGDGIVSVLPVEQVYRIRTQSAATGEEL